MKNKKRILFAGYAPVHFLCFKPVYDKLVKDPEVELYLSGGFKTKSSDQVSYELNGFYENFGVNQGRVIPLEQAREESFDVLVCAHLSDDFFPRSVGKSVQIFHGVSFKNLAIRDKALKFDVLCLPGRYHAERYLEKGLVRQDGPLCLVTGFPKVDPLVQGALDRSALLQNLNLNPTLPTVLLAPTGEKDNALETAGEALLEAIVDVGDFNLLVKPHDHPKNKIDWFERLRPMESERLRLVRSLDVVPLLHASDLLITDASSVAVEYTLLDRPIVFYDVPKLFKRVRKRAPAMDLETYGRKIGRVVESQTEAALAVQELLRTPGQENAIRRSMASHVFHHPGHASETVTQVVRYAAGLTPEIPASALILREGGFPVSSSAA